MDERSMEWRPHGPYGFSLWVNGQRARLVLFPSGPNPRDNASGRPEWRPSREDLSRALASLGPITEEQMKPLSELHPK